MNGHTERNRLKASAVQATAGHGVEDHTGTACRNRVKGPREGTA